MEQHATTYVESVRLRMIAQGIPFKAPSFSERAGLSTRVPVFDRLRLPLPVQDHPRDLRPRLVKSTIDIPPRRIQPTTTLIAERKDP